MNAPSLSWLLAIPVLLPFLGAALALVFARHRRLPGWISVITLTVVLATAVAITLTAADAPLALDVGGWAAPVGITLVADRLSALMLVTSVFVTLCVLVYSLTQDVMESAKAPVTVYHPTFLVLSAGVSNAFLTGDLFNLYVGFEMLLVASFVLITLGATRQRIRSGTVYVVVSLVSSVLFLLALALTYAAAGTVNMAQLSVRMGQINPGMALTIQVMLLVAFGVKAAVFPVAAWLPDSYPTAPAPVTAVFAGLLTKVGVYAMIRTQTLLFPYGRLDDVLLVVGIATMIVGILGAVAQDDLKRLLSFTLVSHIGFMVWGIGLGTSAGLGAAIFYTVHHIIVQTALFLVSGLVEHLGGTTSLVKLGSLLTTAPWLAALYLVPALNLAGVPPMSGFLGKLGLVQASVEIASPLAWVTLGAGLLSSLLTLYAMTKAWNMAFWQEAVDPLPMTRAPRLMVFSTALLVLVSLLLTVFSPQFYGYISGGARYLKDPSSYIAAVLPEGGRGTGQSPDIAKARRRAQQAPVTPSATASGDVPGQNAPDSPVPGQDTTPAIGGD